jgi:hypothetical protein
MNEVKLLPCQEKLEALAERIPPSCEWSTGTGTKRSHAQIIAPHIRRNSFYAVANTEEDALRLAIEELEQFVATTRLGT